MDTPDQSRLPAQGNAPLQPYRYQGVRMKTAYETMRDDQLNRKLQLYLGSKIDWMQIYANWCADNSVSQGEQYDEHHIILFVRQQKKAMVA